MSDELSNARANLKPVGGKAKDPAAKQAKKKELAAPLIDDGTPKPEVLLFLLFPSSLSLFSLMYYDFISFKELLC
jgi:hypothetical protein